MASLSVHLKHSMQLTVIISFAHFIVACLWWELILAIPAKLIGISILVASLVFYLRHYALLKSARSVVAFELTEALECTLETKCGEYIICRILGSTFVAPYLVVLNVKSFGEFFSRSVVIVADGIDTEEFRLLRVLLRWKWKLPS